MRPVGVLQNDYVETDVNQELMVLDADQSDAFAGTFVAVMLYVLSPVADKFTERQRVGDDTQTHRRHTVESPQVCISTLGFALLLTAMISLLLLSAMAVLVAHRYRRPMHERWAAMTGHDDKTTTSCTSETVTPHDSVSGTLRARIAQVWPTR
jgi:hypothetical protein